MNMENKEEAKGSAHSGILIADSGSTKTDWALVFPHGEAQLSICEPQGWNGEIRLFHTQGINPVQMKDEQIVAGVEEMRALLPAQTKIAAVYFYGAGCLGQQRRKVVEQAIREALNSCLTDENSYLIYNKVYEAHNTEGHTLNNDSEEKGITDKGGGLVSVESDMLGAARALCQHKEGIACILGTGSNSCLYDGERIVSNTPPLGYILGDEGSGAYIARMLVANILKGLTSKRIAHLFEEETGLTQETVIDHVYRKPLANKWLASLMPFVKRHKEEGELREIVAEAFDAFVRRNIMQYERKDLPLNFTGSVAQTYEDILRAAIKSQGMKMGVVIRRPIDGLIRYHCEK